MRITDSLLAAYAKGNTSDEERLLVRQYLIDNPEEMTKMIRLMDGSLDEAEAETVLGGLSRIADESMEEIQSPLYAVAADNTGDKLCVIRCEGYALRKLGLQIEDKTLEVEAKEHGWLTDRGTLIKDIGRLSELNGCKVQRQLNSSLEEIQTCLKQNQIVIVAVDEGELVGDKALEELEDIFIGGHPDHVVIVTEINEKEDTVTIVDPNTPELNDTYPTDFFLDAWEDSNNYLISINR